VKLKEIDGHVERCFVGCRDRTLEFATAPGQFLHRRPTLYACGNFVRIAGDVSVPPAMRRMPLQASHNFGIAALVNTKHSLILPEGTAVVY
jgi:hypothetical protein